MPILTKGALRSVYKSYRKRALDKSLPFELTLIQFNKLIQSTCVYCGTKAEDNKRSGKVNFNGVDRIDNKKGYTINNSGACCSMCNYMKASYTVKAFLAHTRKISKSNVLCATA
jgi:hypothetical protein